MNTTTGMIRVLIYQLYAGTCYRLEQWADYNRDAFGLGFPKMSIEQMAVEGGGIDTRGSGLKLSETPEHIQEIDDVLLQLKLNNLDHYKAIRYYFETGSISHMFRKAGFKNRHKAREALNLAVCFVHTKMN